jgi:hypothetical protein
MPTVSIRCTCEVLETFQEALCLQTTSLGCPIHAVDLYLDYLAARFEAGPTSLEYWEDYERPDHMLVTVDGKTASLPRSEALQIIHDVTEAIRYSIGLAWV